MYLKKFKRRTSVVKKNEIDKYWEHFTLLYMTEKSDDPENPNGIVEHKLLWRSSSKYSIGAFSHSIFRNHNYY